jgi:hypothetical protein
MPGGVTCGGHNSPKSTPSPSNQLLEARDQKAQSRNSGHLFQLVMVYELSEAHR